MISAIQTVPNIAAFSALPNLGRISYLTQGANSSIPIPSTILTLGTKLPVPLTYNAAGQFETLLQGTGTDYNSAATGLDTTTTASVFNAMNILQGVASDNTGKALNNLLSADLVLAAAPAIPAATAATRPISVPTTTATMEAVSGTAAASSNLASNFLADDAAQTLANIASDPSYANIAAALYMSAAMFRSQHAADVALPNTSRSIPPVKELRAVYPV
ncbi:MAG: hypothetical protein PHQ05_08105 [Sterolibacterium sp.]|nr:hypothetical protein [Sterolibacterium sp.]